VMFLSRPGAHAVLAVYLLGTLFLPEVSSAPIFPESPRPLTLPLLSFSKENVMHYGVLLGWLIADAGRLRSLRFNVCDVPALLFILCPVFSGLAHGLNFNEVFAEVRQLFLSWGVPYLMGRMYLGDREGMRAWTAAVILGGLIYVPFCL